MPDRISRGALVATLLLAVAAACSEQTTSSIGCPSLCSDESATLRDTVLTEAVELDTTFVGFPRLGTTRDVTLVQQGDTSDVRAVVRFDQPGVDTLTTFVDSAMLTLVVDTLFAKPKVAIRIDAFDVDTTANDTIPNTLVPLFRADRLLGSVTLQPSEVKDTLRIPLDSAKLHAKITANKRIRVGLQVSGAGLVRLRVRGSVMLPFIRLRVSKDTLVPPDTIRAVSTTPTTDALTASTLSIYPIIVAGSLKPPPPSLLAVGGIAGARSYLRFNIPAIVLDSVQIIRATVQLTQTPTRSTAASDTLTLALQPVIAGAAVSDIFTASQFLDVPTRYGIDTLRLVPKDSGARAIEVVGLVRSWRAFAVTDQPRAIVLRVVQEGGTPAELDFFSMNAATPAVRPRLKLTYVPRRGFGLP